LPISIPESPDKSSSKYRVAMKETMNGAKV
jgi:hypothetical protein